MHVRSDAEPHTPLMGQLLVGWISLVSRRPRCVIFLALVTCIACVYTASTQLTYQTQRADLISAEKECQQRWQKYVAEFGDDDDIVVVIKGAQPTDRAEMTSAIDAVAAEVQQEGEHFDRLFYQVDLRGHRDRALLFLPVDQIEHIRKNLQCMTLLLEVGPLAWENLSLLSLLREANARAATLAAGESMPPADVEFFTQLRAVTGVAADVLQDPNRYRNPWNSLTGENSDQQRMLDEPQYFFSGDGTLAFLLARPIKDPTSFTGAQRSVEAMRSIVAHVRSSFPRLEIGLTGLPVLETDEMVAAERDTARASWLAIAGVTLLFLVVYRGIYYPLLTVGTLLLGTSWALGWTALTVGHLNILSATFAVMLIGLGDYGVLWVMRYERERQRGAGVEEALRHTAVCVGTGTLTAALTTALAFYAAMLADFKAVVELGWIAGSGVLFCAFACFTVLPAALVVFDRRRTFQVDIPNRSASPFETWLPGLMRHPRFVLMGCAVLAVGLGAFATRVSYDHNLLNLQACDLDSVKWEKTLIEHTAGASWHALSYTRTAEGAQALKARFEQLPEVSRVIEVASLVPTEQESKHALLRDIQRRLGRLPEHDQAIRRDAPEPAQLRSAIEAAFAALDPLVRANGSELLDEVTRRLSTLHARLSEGDGPTLHQFEEHMVADLIADLHQLRGVSTPEPITLDDLPGSLRERYVGRTGLWKLQVFARDNLWDFEPMQHFVNRIREVDPEATGKPFSTVEGLLAMKNGFLRAGFYAFVAIVAVLLIDFRRIGRTLIAISPLVLGLTFALGVMGVFGVHLNPANMIALPLVLGVGVDNGVHVLHDFLARKTEGQFHLSRAIGRGVLVKALTTMIGFGTLMISTQRGLAGLGFCLTLGVACCMFAALVFLPALLSLRTRTVPIAEAAEPFPRRLAA